MRLHIAFVRSVVYLSNPWPVNRTYDLARALLDCLGVSKMESYQMKAKVVALTAVLLAAIVSLPGPVHGHGASVQGVVDVEPFGAGGALTLPLPPGSPPVIVNLSLGIPSIQILVTITSETDIDAEDGLPITVVDGDLVEIELKPGASGLVATELKVREFPELELEGTALGVPATGVSLPLPSGITIDFVISLFGFELPLRVTGETQVKNGPLSLFNGVPIRIEGAIRDFVIVVTEIELGS